MSNEDIQKHAEKIERVDNNPTSMSVDEVNKKCAEIEECDCEADYGVDEEDLCENCHLPVHPANDLAPPMVDTTARAYNKDRMN